MKKIFILLKVKFILLTQEYSEIIIENIMNVSRSHGYNIIKNTDNSFEY